MAAGRILSVQQSLSFNTYAKCWNVPQKGCYSTRRTEIALKQMGFPSRPKRPSKFGSFNAEVRPSVRKQYPDKTFGEITKIVANQWQKLSEDEKARYTKEYKEKLEKFRLDIVEYKKILETENTKHILSALDVTQRQKSYSKILKEEEKALNKPKCSCTPFSIFLKELREKNSLPIAEVVKEWKNLTDYDRQRYSIQFKKEREKYGEDLKRWEDKMIKQGKLDFVRLTTLKEKLKDYF